MKNLLFLTALFLATAIAKANTSENIFLTSNLSCHSGGKASTFEAHFENSEFNFVVSSTLGGISRKEKIELLGVETNTTTDYNYNEIIYPVTVLETKSFLLDLYSLADVYPNSSANRFNLTITSKLTKVSTRVYCDLKK